MELWLFALLMVFFVVVAVSQATSVGSVVSMDDDGFVLHSQLRTFHKVLWKDLRGPAWLFSNDVPGKIAIGRRGPFVSFHFKYLIIREPSEFDDRFVMELKWRIGVREWS